MRFSKSSIFIAIATLTRFVRGASDATPGTKIQKRSEKGIAVHTVELEQSGSGSKIQWTAESGTVRFQDDTHLLFKEKSGDFTKTGENLSRRIAAIHFGSVTGFEINVDDADYEFKIQSKQEHPAQTKVLKFRISASDHFNACAFSNALFRIPAMSRWEKQNAKLKPARDTAGDKAKALQAIGNKRYNAYYVHLFVTDPLYYTWQEGYKGPMISIDMRGFPETVPELKLFAPCGEKIYAIDLKSMGMRRTEINHYDTNAVQFVLRGTSDGVTKKLIFTMSKDKLHDGAKEMEDIFCALTGTITTNEALESLDIQRIDSLEQKIYDDYCEWETRKEVKKHLQIAERLKQQRKETLDHQRRERHREGQVTDKACEQHSIFKHFTKRQRDTLREAHEDELDEIRFRVKKGSGFRKFETFTRKELEEFFGKPKYADQRASGWRW